MAIDSVKNVILNFYTLKISISYVKILPKRGEFMIKFIASDIDGTIIGENNSIHENNLKAIEKMNSNPDVTFAVCTGKSYSIFKNTCKKLKARFGIFGNGNQIIDLSSGKEIYKVVLDMNDVNYCLDIAKKYGLHTHLYTESKIITTELKYMDLRNYILSQNKFYDNDLNFEIVSDIKEYLNHNKEEIFQVVISSDESLFPIKNEILKDRNLEICEIKKFGIYKDIIIDKEYEYLSITPMGVDKATALDFLIHYLKINSSDVMTIGDNLNDITMIKNFGVGVAVANSYDEVKHISQYVTQKDVNHGGFAEAVFNFVHF